MTEPALQKLSEADYLRTEESSAYKREYVDGFMYALNGEDLPHAQAGALSRHGLIALNIATLLNHPARQKGCKAYASDMRVRIDDSRKVRYYPDFVMTCENVDDNASFLISPCFITEVLSESTRNIDRREKLNDYTALPSVQGYLLVDSRSRSAAIWRRNGKEWMFEVLEDSIALPCPEVTLKLAELYDGTSL